jgi:hypothetical protein
MLTESAIRRLPKRKDPAAYTGASFVIVQSRGAASPTRSL